MRNQALHLWNQRASTLFPQNVMWAKALGHLKDRVYEVFSNILSECKCAAEAFSDRDHLSHRKAPPLLCMLTAQPFALSCESTAHRGSGERLSDPASHFLHYKMPPTPSQVAVWTGIGKMALSRATCLFWMNLDRAVASRPKTGQSGQAWPPSVNKWYSRTKILAKHYWIQILQQCMSKLPFAVSNWGIKTLSIPVRDQTLSSTLPSLSYMGFSSSFLLTVWPIHNNFLISLRSGFYIPKPCFVYGSSLLCHMLPLSPFWELLLKISWINTHFGDTSGTLPSFSWLQQGHQSMLEMGLPWKRQPLYILMEIKISTSMR